MMAVYVDVINLALYIIVHSMFFITGLEIDHTIILSIAQAVAKLIFLKYFLTQTLMNVIYQNARI